MTDVDRPLRVALAQINTTVGDIDGNAAKIVDYLGARARGRARSSSSSRSWRSTGIRPRTCC